MPGSTSGGRFPTEWLVCPPPRPLHHRDVCAVVALQRLVTRARRGSVVTDWSRFSGATAVSTPRSRLDENSRRRLPVPAQRAANHPPRGSSTPRRRPLSRRPRSGDPTELRSRKRRRERQPFRRADDVEAIRGPTEGHGGAARPRGASSRARRLIFTDRPRALLSMRSSGPRHHQTCRSGPTFRSGAFCMPGRLLPDLLPNGLARDSSRPYLAAPSSGNRLILGADRGTLGT